MSDDFSQLFERPSWNEERSQLGEYGAIRPMLTTMWKGQRTVVVGSSLYLGSWKLFTDFLIASFTPHILGTDWLNREARKPITEWHPVLRWWRELSSPNATHVVNGNVEKRAGAGVKSFIRLGWDLYILEHHSSLPQRLITRLRHPREFQGARYELWAAAPCVRAGCKLDFENEGDGSRKHPEFVATHQQTGQKFAIEAKSRHRPGTKGRTDERAQDIKDWELGINRLLAKACGKNIAAPSVIFIDANLPGFRGIQARGFKIFSDMDHHSPPPQKWNMVLVTNHPEEFDETVPEPASREVFGMSASSPLYAFEHPHVLAARGESPGRARGNHAGRQPRPA